MKQVKWIACLFALVAIAGTGCLKDKGFDNHEYGINDPDGSPAGVGFTLGTKFDNNKGLVNAGLVLSSAPQTLDGQTVLISLLSGHPASADIHIQVAVDQSYVTTYNALATTTDPLTELDPSIYSLGSTDVVIPAGSFNAPIVINVPTTVTLDPDVVYGLGLKIVSADAGYLVADNENRLLVSIAIKNAYDGDYTSNGYLYHPTAARSIDAYPKSLTTVNATTVRCYLGDLGPNGYIADFDVDPAPPHHVTVSAAPGAPNAPYSQWDSGLPTTAPGPAYTPQWPGSAECNNTYDEGTESFKMRYGYVGASGFRISEEIIVRD